jgi:hypothetical protein
VYFWLMYASIGVILTAPFVFFARRRVEWQWWELGAYVLPFWIWAALVVTGSQPKSLANLGEVGNLLIALVVLAIVRVAVGRHRAATSLAVFGQAALCGAAALTYFLTPVLPE